MKIVCDNCKAKYSIADEKVAGKVFKIRCKKCTNVIVVRGDQVAAAEQEPATQVYDYGGDAVWHVVVDGEQQGPFAPAQIGQMLTAGTIDWEAYVWREGFDGWQPARDVPELVTAVSGEPQEQAPAAAAPVEAAAAPAGDMGADPFAADAGASPFGGEDPYAAGGGNDAFGGGGAFGGGNDAFGGGGDAAVAPSQDAGADLFAQSEASAFGGAADDDVVASAPSPRVSTEQAMTGQRNENSVLFSLSNLQALATGGDESPSGGAAPSPAAPAGQASGEGSGLIDIRALASVGAGVGAGPASSAPQGTEDLLSIGGGGLGGGGLGAPMLAPAAPEPEKSNKGMLVGIGIAALLVVGLAVALIVVLTKPDEPVAAATQAPAATPAAAPAAAAAAAPAAAAAAPADMAAAVVTPMTEAPAEEAAAADSESQGSEMRSSGRRRRPSNGGGGGGNAAPSRPAPAMSAAPSMMARNSVMGDIDDLLGAALSGSSMMSSMSTASMMSSNLPEQPSRGNVRSALQGVSSRVANCGGGQSGVAQAAIVFANSGRVRSVRVTGVPPNVQGCVSRGVRSARVEPFSRQTFNVNFPFRVR